MGASVLIAGQPSSPPHLGCAYRMPFGTHREPFLEITGIQQKGNPHKILTIMVELSGLEPPTS